MTIVQAVLTGVELFSDVGIAPSIIQSHRGDDIKFLNTAWTVQVLRGIFIWLIACVMAFPMAGFYKEPQLLMLIPTVGLNSIIGGLNSTKLLTANRKLMMGRWTIVEVGSYVIGLVSMVVLALLYRSVWSLVIGGLIGTSAKLVFSHVALQGERNWFYWDKSAFEEIHRFGRWIFVSTASTFLASYGDRLLLGKLVSLSILGVYNIALMFAQLPIEILRQLSGKAMFASYAEIVRERPERLYPVLRKSRMVLLALGWVMALFFIILGEPMVNLLYKGEYTQAGWMLRILALGSLGTVLGTSYDGVLLAQGRSFEMTLLQLTQIALKLTGVLVGASINGIQGVVIGMAIAAWALYPFEVICFRRIHLWQPEVDLPTFGFAAAIVATAIWLQ